MKTVLCYGDSNTYGYNPENGLRYPEDVRWTGRMAGILGRGYRVIEEGCNGRTTVLTDPAEGWKNGLPYLKPCLNTHKPVDIVILMLGSNDLKRVFHATAEQAAHGAETLVETILEFTKEKQGFAPQILLVSPPEIRPGIGSSAFNLSYAESAAEESKQFKKYYQAVAARHGCVFFDAAPWAEASETDCLHLTAESHRILAEKLSEAVLGLPSETGSHSGGE